MSKPEETLDVLDETLDIPEVESETQITDLVDDLDGKAEIGEIMEEESLRYFDIQENLIPSTTTTTTNDGVRRLTYSKSS